MSAEILDTQMAPCGGYAPNPKFTDNIITIHKLYEQQLYM